MAGQTVPVPRSRTELRRHGVEIYRPYALLDVSMTTSIASEIDAAGSTSRPARARSQADPAARAAFRRPLTALVLPFVDDAHGRDAAT